MRVHTDAPAAQSADAVGARAYTVGRHIVFGRGQYSPATAEGRRVLAHELTHVVQQQWATKPSSLRIGPAHDRHEREAQRVAVGLQQPTYDPEQIALRRDLARPPRAPGTVPRVLTADEIAAAIDFNSRRFTDPYSVRILRDVVGLEPVPAVVDESFVQRVVEWQAERGLRQDGQVGNLTTRSFFLELVAEGRLRDAVLLVMDSYGLLRGSRLGDLRVGSGAGCCSTATVPAADAVTRGGPQCDGGTLLICFCRTSVPRTAAGYNHFVRIALHETIHIPHCAVGPTDPDAREVGCF